MIFWIPCEIIHFVFGVNTENVHARLVIICYMKNLTKVAWLKCSYLINQLISAMMHGIRFIFVTLSHHLLSCLYMCVQRSLFSFKAVFDPNMRIKVVFLQCMWCIWGTVMEIYFHLHWYSPQMIKHFTWVHVSNNTTYSAMVIKRYKYSIWQRTIMMSKLFHTRVNFLAGVVKIHGRLVLNLARLPYFVPVSFLFTHCFHCFEL